MYQHQHQDPGKGKKNKKREVLSTEHCTLVTLPALRGKRGAQSTLQRAIVLRVLRVLLCTIRNYNYNAQCTTHNTQTHFYNCKL